MSEIQPALLTRSEIEWLLGNKEVSKLYERKIRCSIKKKIETLTELEIPLLVDMGFSVTTRGNGVTIGGNASGLGEDSLVGHGIANPHLKSNNVISDTKDKGAGSGNFASKAPFSAVPSRHFEPTCPFGHGISNPTPYQARRPPLGMRFTLKHNINVAVVFFVIAIVGVAALTLRRCNATIQRCSTSSYSILRSFNFFFSLHLT